MQNIHTQAITPSVLEDALTRELNSRTRLGDVFLMLLKYSKAAEREFSCAVNFCFEPGAKPLKDVKLAVKKGLKHGNTHSVGYDLSYMQEQGPRLSIFSIHTHFQGIVPSGEDLACARSFAGMKTSTGLLVKNPDLRMIIAPVKKRYSGLFIMQEKNRAKAHDELVDLGEILFRDVRSRNRMGAAHEYAGLLEESGLFKTYATSFNKKGKIRKKDIDAIAEKFAYMIRITQNVQA